MEQWQLPWRLQDLRQSGWVPWWLFWADNKLLVSSQHGLHNQAVLTLLVRWPHSSCMPSASCTAHLNKSASKFAETMALTWIAGVMRYADSKEVRSKHFKPLTVLSLLPIRILDAVVWAQPG